jgi:hypothetical protein
MKERLEQLLFAYEMGVSEPESSGMAHLDLLLTRSVLANATDQLSRAQKTPLTRADTRLAQHAADFYRAVAQVADLKSWREQENAPSTHWWWYLDVLLAAPVRLAA